MFKNYALWLNDPLCLRKDGLVLIPSFVLPNNGVPILYLISTCACCYDCEKYRGLNFNNYSKEASITFDNLCDFCRKARYV